MRRPQAGNAGVVVLIVVAALLWWKWDLISAWLGSAFSMGRGTVAELVDYRCDRSGSRVVVDGRVRNVSDAPIGLRAVTSMNYDASGMKAESLEATVRPSPLPPGETGSFRADGPPLPEGGSCKLDGFLDSDTGRPVAYRRR